MDVQNGVPLAHHLRHAVTAELRHLRRGQRGGGAQDLFGQPVAADADAQALGLPDLLHGGAGHIDAEVPVRIVILDHLIRQDLGLGGAPGGDADENEVIPVPAQVIALIEQLGGGVDGTHQVPLPAAGVQLHPVQQGLGLRVQGQNAQDFVFLVQHIFQRRVHIQTDVGIVRVILVVAVEQAGHQEDQHGGCGGDAPQRPLAEGDQGPAHLHGRAHRAAPLQLPDRAVVAEDDGGRAFVVKHHSLQASSPPSRM